MAAIAAFFTPPHFTPQTIRAHNPASRYKPGAKKWGADVTNDENLSENTQRLQPPELPPSLPQSLADLLKAQTQATLTNAQAIQAQTQALQALAQSIDCLIGQNQSMLDAILSAHAEPDQTPLDTEL